MRTIRNFVGVFAGRVTQPCRNDLKVVSIKSISIMSNESIKRINKVWKSFLIILALAIGIGAMLKNPCHLITAGVILACGFESEIVRNEE